MKPLGLYIHIPFCLKKCRYCDFLSFHEKNKELHLAYIEAVLTEIRHSGLAHEAQTVDTVFIGGGTPSIYDGVQIERILLALRRFYNLLPDAELTIEANPATVTKETLVAYREAGINRLSLGVQSLDSKLLDLLGRIHSPEDALQTLEDARAAGFRNINLDLMFSIPEQTEEIWLRDLSSILEQRPEHLSFYSLQIEEGTPFYSLRQQGKLLLPDEETDRSMYWEAASKIKETGYHHYEISNAALPEKECRHNLKYWTMESYLGLGLGAHSYVNGWRFHNQTKLEDYLRVSRELQPRNQVRYKELQESPFVADRHRNTLQDEMGEFLFTGMRLLEGISLSEFQDRFGQSVTDRYSKEIAKHVKNGLLQLDLVGNRMAFTAKGIDLSNFVLSDFV